MWKHALKPSSFSLLTLVGLTFAQLLGRHGHRREHLPAPGPRNAGHRGHRSPGPGRRPGHGRVRRRRVPAAQPAGRPALRRARPTHEGALMTDVMIGRRGRARPRSTPRQAHAPARTTSPDLDRHDHRLEPGSGWSSSGASSPTCSRSHDPSVDVGAGIEDTTVHRLVRPARHRRVRPRPALAGHLRRAPVPRRRPRLGGHRDGRRPRRRHRRRLPAGPGRLVRRRRDRLDAVRPGTDPADRRRGDAAAELQHRHHRPVADRLPELHSPGPRPTRCGTASSEFVVAVPRPRREDHAPCCCARSSRTCSAASACSPA